MRSKLMIPVVAVAALGLLACGAGSKTGAQPSESKVSTASQAPAGEPSKAAPTKAASRVIIPADETVVVGDDVPAGTYEARAEDKLCVYRSFKHGSSFEGTADFGTGKGHHTITLKVGQDFKSVRCGEWTLVK